MKKPKPELVIVKIQSTRDWDQEFVKKSQIKEIWDVYLYDQNERTFCCELTPSYCLNYMDTHAYFADGISDEDRDEAEESIMESTAWNDRVSYYHCSAIDSLPEEHKDRNNPLDDYDDTDWSDDEQYQAVIDDYIGYYRANPSFA